MSKTNNITEFLTGIANTIRVWLKTTDKIDPQEFENCIDNIYYEGKNDEYDAFWDGHQQSGNRKDYRHAFSGIGWTNETFNPKYNAVVQNAESMFYLSNSDSFSIDLTQPVGTSAVTFDFSNCTNYVTWLAYSRITAVPKVDLSKTSYGAYTIFRLATRLETVTELHFPDEKIEYANATLYAFDSCTALKNITVTGTILNTGFDLHWSTLLTVKSLTSILTALSKDSTKAAGLKITLPATAQAKINADATAKTQYDEAIAAGWTIAFV